MTKLLLLAAFALLLSGCSPEDPATGPCPKEYTQFVKRCEGLTPIMHIPLCAEAEKRYKKCLKEAPSL